MYVVTIKTTESVPPCNYISYYYMRFRISTHCFTALQVLNWIRCWLIIKILKREWTTEKCWGGFPQKMYYVCKTLVTKTTIIEFVAFPKIFVNIYCGDYISQCY